ncbi:uncharacterized protein KZ484_011019 [Pholidichthys leucotaenia]
MAHDQLTEHINSAEMKTELLTLLGDLTLARAIELVLQLETTDRLALELSECLSWRQLKCPITTRIADPDSNGSMKEDMGGANAVELSLSKGNRVQNFHQSPVYRAEVDRHGESFDVDEMESRRKDFPEQHVCENKFSPDQQLWNQEENSASEQEEPGTPQVKEEQEELCISQEGDQLEVKLESNTFMVTLEEKQQSEAEPNSEQLLSHNPAGTEIQDEEGSHHVDSGLTKEEDKPKPKKRRLKTRSHHEDAPQLHDCKEEVLTVQQLCNQERNSSLDQEEQYATQVKEEEEELCEVDEDLHSHLDGEREVSPDYR